ncbi:MAG: hypothetical protein A2289_07695 [Deltaproteobacteria bacterium RIFOXYA12_FULL_58_15]|nr:MAG: hypothetical protein A2289_07695 [Deltaproteobacteria bacterium RIFOXYA12_FULL_58_15]OGR09619.1 MAG: hypothetical protein A2341_00400 [Deltaproteobacteria bacterium RIFOXYB12_FULL_58_9]
MRSDATVIVFCVPFSSIVRDEELERFDSELTAIADKDPSALLAIDFSQTFHISSRALGILAVTRKKLNKGGGRIVLFGTNPAIEKVMKVTHLDTLMPMVEDRTKAEELLRAEDGTVR